MKKKSPGSSSLMLAALLIWLALIAALLCLSGCGAAPESRGSGSSSGAEADFLAGLAESIEPEMALEENGARYLGELSALALERPELAERLKFIAEHIDIYSEAAVKTALQSEEKLDFALLLPFRTPDASGLGERVELTGGVPYMRQYDSRWGYHAYGSGALGITGCGPTCLAMAAAYLKGDAALNPALMADFAERHGFYVPGEGTRWSLFTTGAAELGLIGEELPLDEGVMRSSLDAGAALVLSMLPGDFTDSGHFIVIDGYSEEGFSVLDPNSPERSAVPWSFEALRGQTANLWSLSAG